MKSANVLPLQLAWPRVARVRVVANFLHIAVYTVCPEKRDQNIFGNISHKTRAILMKSNTRFPE